MRYVSTRGVAPPLGFDDTVLTGLATDGGLYVPETWPALDVMPGPQASYAEVAATTIRPFIDGSVIAAGIEELTAATYRRFRHPEVAPLIEVEPDRFLLELFWGPTLSFKDYALQFVGAVFDAILEARGQRILVLGATSGDTGSAAIEACRDRTAIDVVILYPEGRVSDVQRRQMTTVDAPNVHAVAVEGTFDDCQDLVKRAFGEPDMRAGFSLAAVNSINWARVMAQAAYYVFVAGRMGRPFDVAVPTGNFGNVFAADVARRLGAPIERLIVGNNANHGLATLIDTGRLPLGPTIATVAPAMDIQVPSNLERLLFDLFDRDPTATADAVTGLKARGAMVLDERRHSMLRERFRAGWADDAAIEETIADVHGRTGIVLDPHTAVGWRVAEAWAEDRPVVAVATAHPAKFPEAVAAAVGRVPALPPDLADLMSRPERTETIAADLTDVRTVLERASRR